MIRRDLQLPTRVAHGVGALGHRVRDGVCMEGVGVTDRERIAVAKPPEVCDA